MPPPAKGEKLNPEILFTLRYAIHRLLILRCIPKNLSNVMMINRQTDLLRCLLRDCYDHQPCPQKITDLWHRTFPDGTTPVCRPKSRAHYHDIRRQSDLPDVTGSG